MISKFNIEFEISKKPKEEVKKTINKIIDSLSKRYKNKNIKARFKLLKSKIGFSVHLEDVNLTEFILQLNKNLREFIGKKHKIGVKDFLILNLNINFKLKQKCLEKVKIPFVDSIEINNKDVKISYKKLDSSFIKNYYIERTVNLIEEKVMKQYYAGKGEYHKILYESKKKKDVWNKNPTEEMAKLGWLKQGPTKGKWFYGPQITAVFRAMEKIVLDKILRPLEFKEVIGSNIISADEIWLKTGHLEGMPMEIYYVNEPKTRDPKEWETFIDKIKITKQVPYEEIKNLIKTKPLMGLTYAQCPILYWFFRGKVIADEELPVLIYDKKQNSFRYESGGRHGIERVDEFHRMEIVFIGTNEQMIKMKDKLFEIYKDIFNNILEIEWRTAWVTPFYMQQAGQIKTDDKERVKGTVDYEAWLPFRGGREKEWLEFQNLSIVGDKYTKAFNIKSQKKELWSGCSGVGLQRWAIAFLAQKGLDPKYWPKEFKKYLPKLPKGFKFY